MAIAAGGPSRPREERWSNVAAATIVVCVVVLAGAGGHLASGPFSIHQQPRITLSPGALPLYALRTTLRMLVALLASLLFTLVYATVAAKSRRAEMVLIPLLDVLQSVPILGYLSFTVVFFLHLFPGRMLGAELAAVFAVFTSQAWNMAFSFYQSLKTLPTELEEAARGFRFSGWQRFWRLEVPFAVPGLVWNMMMSMSGGWFFVVAAEAISVGDVQVTLPGIGSYVALAIHRRDLGAVGWAILAMTASILIYDRLLFRPLVVWAQRFRVEQTAPRVVARSLVWDLFARAKGVGAVFGSLGRWGDRLARLRMSLAVRIPSGPPGSPASRWIDRLWYAVVGSLVAWGVVSLVNHESASLGWSDVETALANGGLTLLRVVVLIFVASAIWVPVGVLVGLNPKLSARVQPVAQFLAAFPANLLFPVAVFLIVRFHASPVIWLTPLMILGAQWYILFNVIAGASSVPTDFREAAATFHIHGWPWWRDVMLPGIFPYFVTGAITASGGAWNASVVSEAVGWGSTRLNGQGLGAYIAQMTERGDFPRIILGVGVMSVMVIAMNRLLWRPLSALAERRARLD